MNMYTPKKMFFLAFSFANFEMTRGSTGKANISLTTLTKKSYSSILKKLSSLDKVRRNIFGGVYVIHVHSPNLVSPCFIKCIFRKVGRNLFCEVKIIDDLTL